MCINIDVDPAKEDAVVTDGKRVSPRKKRLRRNGDRRNDRKARADRFQDVVAMLRKVGKNIKKATTGSASAAASATGPEASAAASATGPEASSAASALAPAASALSPAASTKPGIFCSDEVMRLAGNYDLRALAVIYLYNI
jgi:hypothetical protein